MVGQELTKNLAAGLLVIVAGVHKSYWKTTALFGVRVTESRLVWISNGKPEITYRRQVVFKCITAALVVMFCCMSNASDVAALRTEV